MNKASQVLLLLGQLEQQLIDLQLWSATPPSDEALASTMPFCCDKMELECWLQFVFIPRLSQMASLGLPLPDHCAIAAMAEESYKGRLDTLMPLLEVLDRIDIALSGKSSRGQGQ